MAKSFGGFSSALIDFFEELQHNNDKAWFEANRARFESQVQQPLLDFTAAIAPKLTAIYPSYEAVAKKSGGSLTRIYRDVRFSSDKTPYNTYLSLRFFHRVGKKTTAPVMGLHVSPRGFYAGLGIFAADGPTLKAIRDAIVAHPEKWQAARDDAAFRREFELTGESLKRPPKGYDPTHPFVADLMRKEFIAHRELERAIYGSATFVDELCRRLATAAPYLGFLCDALGLER